MTCPICDHVETAPQQIPAISSDNKYERFLCGQCKYVYHVNADGRKKEPGTMTGRLAAELRGLIANDFRVVCDRRYLGDADTFELFQTQAYFVDEEHQIGNGTRHGEIDIAIIKRDSGQVRVLVEVEESKNEPKHILGDALSLIWAKAVTVKEAGHVFPVNENVVSIVGAWILPNPQKIEQYEGIKRKLDDSHNVRLRYVLGNKQNRQEGLDNLRTMLRDEIVGLFTNG